MGRKAQLDLPRQPSFVLAAGADGLFHPYLALERIEDCIKKDGQRVVVPTPVLAEFLCHKPEDREPMIEELLRLPKWDLAAFDARAAVEHAKITARAILNGDKRDGSDKEWKCVKFDRQVVAIAKSKGCSLIITEDSGLSAFATIAGIEAMNVSDLPIPDSARQGKIEYPMADDSEAGSW